MSQVFYRTLRRARRQTTGNSSELPSLCAERHCALCQEIHPVGLRPGLTKRTWHLPFSLTAPPHWRLAKPPAFFAPPLYPEMSSASPTSGKRRVSRPTTPNLAECVFASSLPASRVCFDEVV